MKWGANSRGVRGMCCRMQEAFTGVAQGVDIFEAAAALADEGRAAAGEMLTTEMVFLQDFMAESLVCASCLLLPLLRLLLLLLLLLRRWEVVVLRLHAVYMQHGPNIV
jgi:hypothetical protein